MDPVAVINQYNHEEISLHLEVVLLDIPDYQQLADALAHIDADYHASAAHGIATAMFVTHQPDAGRWLGEVLAGTDSADLFVKDTRQMLAAVYMQLDQQFSGNSFDFTPLLPDDATDMNQRVRALSEWSQGFLYGLGLAGVSEQQQMSEQAREIVNDLVAFTQVEEQEEAATEEDERALTELVEYLRAAVQLLHEELRPPADSNTADVPPS
jgi:yecA family protein